MSQQVIFAEVLDAAEQLDADAQAELVAVLCRRLAERGRERVAAVVAEALCELAAGQCQPMTAAELVRERSCETHAVTLACVRPRPAEVAEVPPHTAASVEATLEQLSADAGHACARTSCVGRSRVAWRAAGVTIFAWYLNSRNMRERRQSCCWPWAPTIKLLMPCAKHLNGSPCATVSGVGNRGMKLTATCPDDSRIRWQGKRCLAR